MTEWSKVAHLRCAGYAIAGSNPAAETDTHGRAVKGVGFKPQLFNQREFESHCVYNLFAVRLHQPTQHTYDEFKFVYFGKYYIITPSFMHIVKVAACGATVYGVMYVATSKNMVPLAVKQRVKPSQYFMNVQEKVQFVHTYSLVAKSSLLGLTWSDEFANFDLALGGERPCILHYQVLDGVAMSHDEKTTKLFECIDDQAANFDTALWAFSRNQKMRQTLEHHGFVLTKTSLDLPSTDLLTKVYIA